MSKKQATKQKFTGSELEPAGELHGVELSPMCIDDEPDRISAYEPNQKLLYCPFAEIRKPAMTTRGKYKNNYPAGAVVHFTAGRTAESSLSYGTEVGFCFFVIAKDGKILQSFSLDSWGYHAGNSAWNGFSGLNRHFVGIEIDCMGQLTYDKTAKVWKSWFGKAVQPANMRTVGRKENMYPGTYEIYTPQQEESLIQLLLWLKRNNPDVFSLDNVCGHDECATPAGRKNDPGGSLSMTMPALRKLLMSSYEATLPKVMP